MTIHPAACWLLSKIGWNSQMVEMKSPSGILKMTVCTRCHSYMMESHGLTFTGRVKKVMKDFPNIGALLDGIGYTAAAREINNLMRVLREDGFA